MPWRSFTQNLVKFLNENGSSFLAAVDNGKFGVRPFQLMMEEGGGFYFCTNNTRDNPIFEVCFIANWAATIADFSGNLPEMVAF